MKCPSDIDQGIHQGGNKVARNKKTKNYMANFEALNYLDDFIKHKPLISEE